MSRLGPKPAIDPDDLAFMVEVGTPLEELSRRVGVTCQHLLRLARQHGIDVPPRWYKIAQEERDRSRAARQEAAGGREGHARRARTGGSRPRGQGMHRPADCCPYCPTVRASLPAEQLAWSMATKPVTCGRLECVRAHERWRYARRKEAA